MRCVPGCIVSCHCCINNEYVPVALTITKITLWPVYVNRHMGLPTIGGVLLSELYSYFYFFPTVIETKAMLTVVSGIFK